MQWHPATQEEQRGDATDHKQVEVLCQIEQAIVDTRILGVIACRELMLSLWEVKRATVILGIGRHNIDDKRDDGRQMALEQMEIDEDRRRRNWTYGGGYEKLAPRTADIRKEALEQAIEDNKKK